MFSALIDAAVQVFKAMWWFFLLIPVIRIVKGTAKTRSKLK